MRIVPALIVIAGCGRAAGPETVTETATVTVTETEAVTETEPVPETVTALALVPSGALGHFDRWDRFSRGAAPLTFAATAPRGAQLIVWAARYRHHRIEPGFCPHRIYRFARAGSVALTVVFDWNPKPGNVFHYYALDVGGTAAGATLVRPDQSATVTDVGDGADPAAAGTDYILYYVLGGRDRATGFGPIADGIAINDGGVVIRARFVAPREQPAGFDVTRCEPSPDPR